MIARAKQGKFVCFLLRNKLSDRSSSIYLNGIADEKIVDR
jgi:hypothetical protein